MKSGMLSLVCLALLALAMSSCESRSRWEGRYVSPLPGDKGGEAILILEGDGKGRWTADTENSPLRWEKRKGALWLHLKTGGILIAEPVPAENALALTLPGVGAILLHKSPK